MNMIPKEGSNRHAVRGHCLRQPRGLRVGTTSATCRMLPYNFRYAPQEFFFDFNPVVGGPIKENKLWYFGSVSGNRSNSPDPRHLLQAGRAPTPEQCRTGPRTIQRSGARPTPARS